MFWWLTLGVQCFCRKCSLFKRPKQESNQHGLWNLDFEGCCCCSRTRVLLEPGLEFDSQQNMCVVESEDQIIDSKIKFFNGSQNYCLLELILQCSRVLIWVFLQVYRYQRLPAFPILAEQLSQLRILLLRYHVGHLFYILSLSCIKECNSLRKGPRGPEGNADLPRLQPWQQLSKVRTFAW